MLQFLPIGAQNGDAGGKADISPALQSFAGDGYGLCDLVRRGTFSLKHLRAVHRVVGDEPLTRPCLPFSANQDLCGAHSFILTQSPVSIRKALAAAGGSTTSSPRISSGQRTARNLAMSAVDTRPTLSPPGSAT